MLDTNRPKIFALLSLLFVVSSAPFFFKPPIPATHPHSINEIFAEKYSSVNSVNKAVKFVDSMYLANYDNTFDTLKYVNLISDFTKNKFYHGLSEYSISENWIANLLGKYTWSHFSAIVDPDDILKYSEGLCSQQTIVFIEILKRKGITYRTIGLGPKEGPGHFLSEVLYNGKWHLYDVDKEPKWGRTVIAHESINYYKENPEILYSVYDQIIDQETLSKMIEVVSYGEINEFPAKNMLFLHRFTKFLTYLFPVLFFILMLIFVFQKRVSKKNTDSISVEKEEEIAELA